MLKLQGFTERFEFTDFPVRAADNLADCQLTLSSPEPVRLTMQICAYTGNRRSRSATSERTCSSLMPCKSNRCWRCCFKARFVEEE